MPKSRQVSIMRTYTMYVTQCKVAFEYDVNLEDVENRIDCQKAPEHADYRQGISQPSARGIGDGDEKGDHENGLPRHNEPIAKLIRVVSRPVSIRVIEREHGEMKAIRKNHYNEDCADTKSRCRQSA